MSDNPHATCPYRGLPQASYWRNSVAEPQMGEVDPVISAPFKIGPKDKVATAGSCFAQHLSNNLTARGFNYYIAENLPSFFPKTLRYEHGYGVFSARFGNIYTARQLVQLFDRAYGTFVPSETHWERNGRFFDPFRPSVQVDGYESLAHLVADRDYHFSCIRKMFETLDVFIFTLGLTESWMSKVDGAVYPVAPGCGYGTFDDAKYQFHNFKASEVTADLRVFLERLKQVNPKAKVILTVSPVPLIATYEPHHVLCSTTYSKSVLRVAAEEIVQDHDHVVYFPSYEIIVGNYNRGSYYDANLRDIKPAGVAHVMKVFFKHFASDGPAAVAAQDGVMATDIICDEELLTKDAE